MKKDKKLEFHISLLVESISSTMNKIDTTNDVATLQFMLSALRDLIDHYLTMIGRE